MGLSAIVSIFSGRTFPAEGLTSAFFMASANVVCFSNGVFFVMEINLFYLLKNTIFIKHSYVRWVTPSKIYKLAQAIAAEPALKQLF
jgi:hypothetical protein